MVPDHEGFRGVPAGARRSGGDRLGLRGIEADRLLAEHVLAGLQRTDGPRRMKMIGQGNVDRIDRRVGDQRLVAVEGAWQAQRRRGLRRPGALAGGDRNHLGAPASAHAGDHFLPGDFRGAEDTEPDPLAHWTSPAVDSGQGRATAACWQAEKWGIPRPIEGQKAFQPPPDAAWRFLA